MSPGISPCMTHLGNGPCNTGSYAQDRVRLILDSLPHVATYGLLCASIIAWFLHLAHLCAPRRLADLLMCRHIAAAQSTVIEREASDQQAVRDRVEIVQDSAVLRGNDKDGLVFAPEDFQAEPGVPCTIQRDSPLHSSDVFRCPDCVREGCDVSSSSDLLICIFFLSWHFCQHNKNAT